MPMDSKDKKITKNNHFIDSMKYAIQGVSTVFKEERNMRFHIFSAIVAILMCVIFKVSQFEWFMILFSCVFVIVIEITNTVVENIVDLTTNFTYHPIAKKAKDMAASAVLIAAIFSLIVGGMVFIPKIMNLF